MDVSYSDTVTNTVKDLRENVYNTEKFKKELKDYRDTIKEENEERQITGDNLVGGAYER